MTYLKALRSLMFFIAISHLAVGLGLMFSIGFQKIAATLYGARLDWTAANIYLLRVIGAFAFVMGLLALLAARNPLRNRLIVLGFIVFFTIRNVTRHIYAGELSEGLLLTPLINYLTTAFFGIQAILLGGLLWIAASRGLKDPGRQGKTKRETQRRGKKSLVNRM
jgi:hypothetical protein